MTDNTILLTESNTAIRLYPEVETKQWENENPFQTTFNCAAIGIAHIDLHGNWLRVNQKLCDILGYLQLELLSHSFQDITHPDDLETEFSFLQQVLSQEIKSYSLEKRYIRKDGSLIWVNSTVSLVNNSSGKPNYFIAFIEDISNRKQIEAQFTDITKTKIQKSIFPFCAQLDEAFQFIEANYHQQISLDDVAQIVGYAPSYLTDLMRRLTGRSVKRWIVERRLAAARALLLETNQTVDRIAEKVGYLNTGHFIRQFRKYQGATPQVWRKIQRTQSNDKQNLL